MKGYKFGSRSERQNRINLFFAPVLILGFLLAFVAFSGMATGADQIIRVAVTPASPPILYEEDGVMKGLDLDIMNAYCASRGCTLEITAYDWQGMLAAVVSGKADVAFSGISITEKRRAVMDFSTPYLDNTWNAISLKSRNITITDLNDLKKYSIGFTRGSAYSEYFKGELEPKGFYAFDQVKLYPSYNEVMTDLRNGNIDLALIDGTVAAVYRKTMDIADSYVWSGFDQFGFAFQKGSPLVVDFDAFLVDLGEEGLKAIVAPWMN
jgi:polar amino acid transport system substrate-binding protein